MSFEHLRIRTRFILLLGLFLTGFLLYGAWSFKTLNALKVNGPLYNQIVQTKDIVADILPPPKYIIESYLVSLQMVQSNDKDQQGRFLERLKALKTDYEARQDYWTKANLGSQMSDLLLKQAHEPALAFFKVAFDELVPAVQKEDKDAVNVAMKGINVAYEAHRKAIDQTVALAIKQAETDEASGKSNIESSTWLLVTILILSVGASIGVALLITQSILTPLHAAVGVASKFASGDLRQR